MASNSEKYTGHVSPDLAKRVEDKRAEMHPKPGEKVSQSKVVNDALETFVDQPTWRQQAHTAAVNLSMLAVVAFVTGETTQLLEMASAAMLAWVLLSVAAGTIAMAEFADILRKRGPAPAALWSTLQRGER